MRLKSRHLSSLLLLPLVLAFGTGILEAQEDEAFKTLIREAGDASRHAGASRVILFDRTRSDVQDSGLTYTVSERLTKVLTASGGLALKSVPFDYDPLSGQVEIKAARIYREDGTVETIDLAKKVHDYAQPARAIYWNLSRVLLEVGRLEVGDALYVKSFRKGFTYALLGGDEGDERFVPPMRGHFYDIIEFYSGTPILEKSYTVLVPKNKPVQYEVYNGEVTAKVHFKGDKIEYAFEKKDIKPFHGEPNAVAHSDVAPKLLISSSPDWFAKSTWFYGVNEDYGSFDVTPEVQAKVDELIKDAKSDEEKVWILTHWCADHVRYSGISMGEGEGFTLHKGEMTYRDRCGVCKDKAGMLITMLRAAGFKSYAAMTMAGSRIDRIPADQFNHSVTLVKLDGRMKLSKCPGFGDYKLLDPTWVPFNRELWSSAEQQQNYLPGVPEGADLQITQLSPPEHHYFRIKGTSRLDDQGNLEGAFTVTAEGQSDAAVRHNMVRRRPMSRWNEYWDGVVHALSPRAELVSVDYDDPYDLTNPIEVKLSYRIPRYATVAGDKMLFVPVVASYPLRDTASFLHINVDLKSRKYPFRDRTSRLVTLAETVELPEGFTAKHLPSYGAVPGEVTSFEGGYEARDGKLYFKSRISLGKRIYDPEDYADFAKSVKGVKHFMNNDVVLAR